MNSKNNKNKVWKMSDNKIYMALKARMEMEKNAG